MTTLTTTIQDPELKESLHEIEHDRRRRKVFALGGLIAVFLAMLAVTFLMYTQTPAERSPDTIGTTPME